MLQTTPNPASGTLNALDSVSCSAAAACTAVGSQQTSTGVSTALAERWNGSSWALQTAVNPSGDTALNLGGVSCPSATWCVAVGENQLKVGSSTAVAEYWNGSVWTLMSPVSPAQAWLSAVSCSSTTSCEAVGSDSTGPLAEHWNGSAWSAQTLSATLGGFEAVSCVSATWCEGTTQDGGTSYAESWNGSTWSTQTYVLPSSRTITFGVSCTSSSNCLSVGYSGSGTELAEHWNGSTWTLLTTPAGGAVLYGVSCTSATSCTAAGDTTNTSGDEVTLAQSWNGSAWTHQASPNPSGAEVANFQGISCPSATDCTAVGDWYASSPNLARTLGEQWTS